MRTKTQQAKARLTIIVGVMLTLLLINLLFGLPWPSLVAKAGPTLPPRKPPATSSPAKSDDDDDDSKPLGAYIELQVAPARTGIWSIVQWQDSAGGWQDVGGWQSPLGVTGYQRWWVAAKDFGSGPFRWIVTQGQGGSILGESEAFTLPRGANETMRVVVSLGP
jgi:hypothetical protein